MSIYASQQPKRELDKLIGLVREALLLLQCCNLEVASKFLMGVHPLAVYSTEQTTKYAHYYMDIRT